MPAGWPAGIYLAAQLLKEAPDVAQALVHLSGSTHIIRDYFIEEVLLQQPISIQDFLLQTSILARLSSQLCDAVCANTNSQARLEYLRQNNLFVTPLDGQGLYYRYHPLFQEALQAWLRQQYPLLERDLQERAAFWYEQQSTDRQIQVKPKMMRPSTRPLSSTLPVYLLTEREREVLTLLLRGASNREIAQDLIISEGTTKKHIANICSKFHVQRRTQVITRMLEQVAM
jgi:ATP/maltotriose-dependent transcriptional regulator MalT